MAKTKISEFSSIPGNNTDIDSINIAENCPPSGINDAIRELMAQLKDFQAGTAGDSFNGPVGTTTAAAGAFTTLSASGAVTLSGGTANGVAYLNNSKVLTTGSALVFDGNNLTQSGANAVVSLQVNTANAGVSASNYSEIQLADTGTVRSYWRSLRDGSGATIFSGNDHIRYALLGSEQMRLTSTGLGIGTSSPSAKLDVRGTIQSVASGAGLSAISSSTFYYMNVSSTGLDTYTDANASAPMLFKTGGTERMRLDSSGNLGLGVTPSAWGSDTKAIQLGGSLFSAFAADLRFLGLANARWDGTNFRYLNTVPALQYRMSAGTGAHEWYTAPSGTAGNAISFTQAMTLDASGRLGVGVTSPAAPIDVQADSGALGLQIRGRAASNLGYIIFRNNANTANLGVIGSGDGGITFDYNSTERARIDSSGNLLVGTTSQVGTSRISAYKNATGYMLGLNAGQASSGSTYYQVEFYSAGNFSGSITSTTSAVAYNTSSDYRLKNITGPITTSGAYIDSLNPVEGTWKADGSTFVGLIAHEAQESSRTQVATGVKDGEEMQAMDYSSSEIIANMIAELKSLRARVAALESI